MGFDVSYHPVDLNLIQERLLPYVTSEGSIDDLVLEAARLAAVRYRANAWGLGVLRVALPSKLRKPCPKPGFWARLFGQEAVEPELAAKPAAPTRFNADLHVWGRPFFITCQGAADVSTAIDDYVVSSPDSVDAVAKRMLHQLDPALVDRVEPDMTGQPPTVEDVREHIFGQLNQLRAAFTKLGTSVKVPSPDGKQMVAEEFLARYLPLTIVSVASELRPGWMARGYVWPTKLLTAAGLNPIAYFQTGKEVFLPLLSRVPSLDKYLEATITTNYTIGGYVPASGVRPLREYLLANKSKIVAPAAQEKWGDYADLCLTKITEALYDAERREMAFVEASEIYSAPMGIMN